MFRIDRNNNMYITKGDDGSFDLELTKADGSIANGQVTFTIRHANNLDSTITSLTSNLVDGKVTFTINSSVTDNLSRKKYVYDLVYTADGKKNTFIGGESSKLAFWVM